jgi:hypothetical protein
MGFVCAALVALTVGMAAPGTAGADEAGARDGCVGPICGTVVNRTSLVVRIATDWPPNSGNTRNLAPFTTSPKGVDVDGFQVPVVYQFQVEFDTAFGKETRWVSGGWHKISTDTVARILTYRVA